MPDYSDFVKTIKQVISETVASMKISDVFYGAVISASPLKVNIDQRFTVGSENLIVPSHLGKKTYTVDVENNTHAHTLSGCDGTIGNNTHKHKAQVTIDNSLKKGDKVILVRAGGGQQYLIIDKVG